MERKGGFKGMKELDLVTDRRWENISKTRGAKICRGGLRMGHFRKGLHVRSGRKGIREGG